MLQMPAIKLSKPLPISCRFNQFPDEVVHTILNFLNEYLPDLLLHSLVSRQWLQVTQQMLKCLAEPCKDKASAMLTPHVAEQFVALPNLPLILSSDSVKSDVVYPEDPLTLFCTKCCTPIMRSQDIISANYRNRIGPAYLAQNCYNTYMSSEEFTASYTTGTYIVKDVTCKSCETLLGVIYTDALDVQNRYKIGKVMLSQRLLFLPDCCTKVKRNLNHERMCEECVHSYRRCVCSLLLHMTASLRPASVRHLHDLLVRQKQRSWRQIFTNSDLKTCIGSELALLAHGRKRDAPALIEFIAEVCSSAQKVVHIDRFQLLSIVVSKSIVTYEDAMIFVKAIRDHWLVVDPNDDAQEQEDNLKTMEVQFNCFLSEVATVVPLSAQQHAELWRAVGLKPPRFHQLVLLRAYLTAAYRMCVRPFLGS